MKPKDYPHLVLEEKVNNLDVKIVGVIHDSEFFSEHESFLEDRVKESDAIVLEQSIGGDFWDSDFFGKLGAIAFRYNKKVYHADPRTLKTTGIDLFQTAIGVSMIVATRLLDSRLPNPLYSIPLGLYTLSGSFLGLLARYLPKTVSAVERDNESIISSSYETLLYGETDYANIMIAEGISKISLKVKDVRKLVCFHGNLHSKPIHTYLRHPNIRKLKHMLYLPTYEPFSNNKVREYTPTEEGYWKFTGNF